MRPQAFESHQLLRPVHLHHRRELHVHHGLVAFWEPQVSDASTAQGASHEERISFGQAPGGGDYAAE